MLKNTLPKRPEPLVPENEEPEPVPENEENEVERSYLHVSFPNFFLGHH